jgi:predicted PurR-regulated permease PerM
MNQTFKNILLLLVFILTGLFLWYFFRIVLYIIISVVFSLLGQPIVDAIQSVKIGRYRIPLGLSAFITLLVLIAVVTSFVSFFFPLLASQAAFISRLDVQTITKSLEVPVMNMEIFLRKWHMIDVNETLGSKLVSELMAIATFERFSNIFSSVINVTAEIFIGFLSISFITFFFLKEKNLFTNIILFFTPQHHRTETGVILWESKHLLRRYLVGLFTDMFSVFLLISIAMWIIGLPNALVIGFFAGLLNIIPYVGPIIATFIGVFLGVSVNLHLDFSTQMLPLIFSIMAAFITVNTIDVGVLQPLIYSKSVKSHPLEIFIVFLMAGMIAGVFGMIIAIPTYSILRIFARQIVIKSRLVKSIRDTINNPEV